MRIIPLFDKIVVKRLEAPKESPGGVILPDGAKEKPSQGHVLSVGPGLILDSGKRGPMTVKKGDLVVFTSYAGTDICIREEDFLIMSESDVLAVLP